METRKKFVNIQTLLKESGNFDSRKPLNVFTLAQKLHEYIFQKGYILEKKGQEWFEEKLETLKKALQAFQNSAEDTLKQACTLIDTALRENATRITCRPRQGSSKQAPVAA